MKISINQLRLELADIEAGHLQLNTFFWGDFPRAVNEDNINYPLMASYYPSAGLLDNQTSLPITIVIADLIYEDYTNLNDVESDTLQYCRDVFNIMNKSTRWQKLGRVESCSLTKFIEGNADVCAGHIMTVNFTLRDSNSICDLPMSGYDFDQDIASSCLPVQIYRNGVLVDTVESGGTYSYTTDTFTYTIKNTNNTTLYSGNVTANLDVTIQDATVENSDASYSEVVTAEGNLVLPDVTINAVNSDLTELASDIVASVTNATLNIPDISFTDSNGTTSSVPAGVDITATPAPNTTIEVNGTIEGTVVSGATVDIQLTDSGGVVTPTSITQVGNDLQVVLPPNVQLYNSAELTRTGQTVSYAAGDDGDLEKGRGGSFFLLPYNSPFGNTNRFTSDNFSAQTTYTNNIVIDWSTYNGTTVLGYKRTIMATTNWATQISNCNALSFGGYTSGWRLCNVKEYQNIANYSLSQTFNYAPFNLSTSSYQHTSTTDPGNTNSALKFYNPGGWCLGDSKLNTATAIACRTFTVTGTTLS